MNRLTLIIIAAIMCGLQAMGGHSQAQVLQDSLSDLRRIDVVEHLGDTIPLGLEFADEAGTPVTLDRYFARGRPVILVLAYYNCPMLCNLVLNGLTAAASQVPWKLGEEYEIVVVSIEPSETPELARSKKQNYLNSLNQTGAGDGFHFLTGSADASSALADAVGFKYFWDEDQKQWAHPAVLTVLSPGGKITRYLYGIEFPERNLRLALVEASEGKVGTSVDRLILYCYHYDPAKGGYVLFAQNIMRLGGIATVFLLALLVALLRWRERRRKGTAASNQVPSQA
jgi:protein SCO1/2